MSGINPNQRLKVNISSLQKIDDSVSTEILVNEMKSILDKGIFGMSFSPYIDGQSPADESIITIEQIYERMRIIAPHTNWVRSFSCSDGNENIPKVAKDLGLKTIVGAWIADDLEKNEKELERVIEVAKAGYADIIAIGNEVLLREELAPEVLISYMRRVKEAVPGVPVAYVDAYYLFDDFKEVTDECDVILCNCYPFWEYCSIDYAIDYMKNMYARATSVAKGKKVIISETGWPNKGGTLGGAVPSYENAMKYFINTYKWAEQDGVEIVYFTSFDEAWKVEDEGECGANWGFWDKDNNYKFDVI